MQQVQQQQIESYNGILLCKRPHSRATVFQTSHQGQNLETTVVSSERTSRIPKKSDRESFWKPSGGSTRNYERHKVITRLKKNDGALRRHKQWLQQMQIQRDEMNRTREEEAKLKEEKKREFKAKQARKRARARDMEDTSTDNCTDSLNETIQNDATSMHHVPTMKSAIPVDKQCRPVWSLTETEAQVKYDDMEQQEEKDLLNFVETLDVESFYDDLELKVLMSQVKDRIRILEKEKKNDESKLRVVLENEMASKYSERFNNPEFVFDEKMFNSTEHGADNEDDEIKSIAYSLVSQQSNDTVSTIHSRKSIQVLLSKAKERITNPSKLMDINEETSTCAGAEINLKYPLTITHQEDDGARIRETKSLNKLPFKNRNPAL